MCVCVCVRERERERENLAFETMVFQMVFQGTKESTVTVYKMLYLYPCMWSSFVASCIRIF